MSQRVFGFRLELETQPINSAPAEPYRLKARTRKTAIWPRVTDDDGQYSGGLAEQPNVI